MLAGLFVSSSIPTAYADRGFAFAAAYVFMQVSRSLFVLWAFREQPVVFRTFLRILVWIVLASSFWLAGGMAQGSTRLALWLLAIFFEFVSPAIRFWTPFLGHSAVSDWNVDGEHMAERCGLFIIIALGESILVTGSIFSGLVWNAANIAAFISSFVGSLLLWWLYFDGSAEAASRTIAEASDPGRLARSAYTYSHLLIVLGIILLAVADEFILEDPTGRTTIATAIALLGGTALYLLGNLFFMWTIWGRLRFSHLIGLVALVLLALAATVIPPVMLTMATTLVLVAIAVGEAYYYRHVPQFQPVPAAVHPESSGG